MEEEELSLTFWGHLEELRSVLIKTAVSILAVSLLSLYYSAALLSLLTETLPPQEKLVILSPQEGFVSLFKLSLWAGFLFTTPYWLRLFLNFIRPALKGKKALFLPGFLALSLIFVTTGILFALKFTLPLSNGYLYHFNETLGKNLWTLSHYLDYVWLLLVAHAAAFEAGALLLCLIHLGILKQETLAAKRRPAFIAALILGALLTPPDVLTQIAIALPLYGFYELAILYGKITSPAHKLDRVCHDHPDTNATLPSDGQTPRAAP